MVHNVSEAPYSIAPSWEESSSFIAHVTGLMFHALQICESWTQITFTLHGFNQDALKVGTTVEVRHNKKFLVTIPAYATHRTSSPVSRFIEHEPWLMQQLSPSKCNAYLLFTGPWREGYFCFAKGGKYLPWKNRCLPTIKSHNASWSK